MCIYIHTHIHIHITHTHTYIYLSIYVYLCTCILHTSVYKAHHTHVPIIPSHLASFKLLCVQLYHSNLLECILNLIYCSTRAALRLLPPLHRAVERGGAGFIASEVRGTTAHLHGHVEEPARRYV